MQRKLGNTTKSLSPSKSIEQIFSSAFKAATKLAKTNPTKIFQADPEIKRQLQFVIIYISNLQNNVIHLLVQFFMSKFGQQ